MVFVHQFGLGFNHIGVDRNALNRTDLHALGLAKMSNALCAFMRVDLIDLLPKVNGLVGTLGLTHIAIDALTGDHQSHKKTNHFFKQMKPNLRKLATQALNFSLNARSIGAETHWETSPPRLAISRTRVLDKD